MQDILEKIIAHKKQEVEQAKQSTSVKLLEQRPHFSRTPISLKKSLRNDDASGIIAEFKRQSPSKGIINNASSVEDVTKGYLKANVSAQSILTDLNFFGGKNEDIEVARTVNSSKPILRKDFIIDEFQIVEAKAIGADVILLIATCLNEKELKRLSDFAYSLGLEVLFEIHTQEDMDKLPANAPIVGINNRNLKTFEVDLEHSIALAKKLPSDSVKISESGISHPETIKMLKKQGFEGFLIGENFMKTNNPSLTCQQFIDQL